MLPEELHRRPFPAHGRGLGRRGKDAAAPAAEQARGVRPRAPGQWRRAALPVVVAGAVGWLHCWLRRCGRAVAVLLPCCCPACGPCLWLPSVRPTSGSPLIRRALSFWTRAGTRAPGRAARLSCGTRPCACSFGVLIACVRVTGILPDPPLFPQACSIGCDKCATDAGGTVPLTGDKPHADKIGFRTRYVVASDSDDALTRHAPAHAMNHLTTCPMVRPCGAPYDPPFVPPHDPPLRRTLRLAPYDSPHDSPYGPPLDPPPRQVLQLHPELDAAEERLDHEHRRRRGYDCVLSWA